MGTTTVNTRPETKIEEDELQLELTARVVLCCWSYGEKKKKKKWMREGEDKARVSSARATRLPPTLSGTVGERRRASRRGATRCGSRGDQAAPTQLWMQNVSYSILARSLRLFSQREWALAVLGVPRSTTLATRYGMHRRARWRRSSLLSLLFDGGESSLTSSLHIDFGVPREPRASKGRPMLLCNAANLHTEQRARLSRLWTLHEGRGSRAPRAIRLHMVPGFAVPKLNL